MGYSIIVDEDKYFYFASLGGLYNVIHNFENVKSNKITYPYLWYFLNNGESYDLENLKKDVINYKKTVSDNFVEIFDRLLNALNSGNKHIFTTQ